MIETYFESTGVFICFLILIPCFFFIVREAIDLLLDR